jgi:hypothetical protein
MATIDGQKTGGRCKGVPNKRNAHLPDVQAMAEKLGINPFEILLRFSANDWQGLGYEAKQRKIVSKSGEVIFVDNIEPSERIAAASKACEYLFPKRRPVDGNGKDSIQSLGLFLEKIIEKSDGEESEQED